MKKGLAIPLVLIFATIMGLISTFLLKSSQNFGKQNQTNFTELQAYFVARAGVEHAMLKVKYLHRELYDAICLSQGRNPVFDFSLISDSDSLTPYNAIRSYNPGPIFLYKEGSYSSTGVFTNNFTKADKDKWIQAFISDLNSNTDSIPTTYKGQKINSVLDFAKMPADIKSKMSEPFKMANYRVSKLNIAAQDIKDKTSKVENNAIVELEINSSILTARDVAWDYTIKKTIKVSRD